MLGGIHNALAALLGKVFVGKAVKSMKTDKGGPQTQERGPQKGAPLGDEGGHLLHGVGYNTADKRTQKKNLAEASHMKTFLDSAKEDGKTDDPLSQLFPQGEETELKEQKQERRDVREANDREVRRDEVREDARVQGQQESKEAEPKEQVEAQDVERQQQDDREEEDKPGAGWVMEEDESEGEENKRGLRDEQVLTDQTRCKGLLDDGTRCLRKPVKGVGYCREHSFNWRPDMTPKA